MACDIFLLLIAMALIVLGGLGCHLPGDAQTVNGGLANSKMQDA